MFIFRTPEWQHSTAKNLFKIFKIFFAPGDLLLQVNPLSNQVHIDFSSGSVGCFWIARPLGWNHLTSFSSGCPSVCLPRAHGIARHLWDASNIFYPCHFCGWVFSRFSPKMSCLMVSSASVVGHFLTLSWKPTGEIKMIQILHYPVT